MNRIINCMGQYQMNRYISVLFITILFSACNQQTNLKKPEFNTVTQNDFNEVNDVSVQLDSGFVLDLWAPGPLLSSPVSLTFDNQGRAYVSETARRKSSDIDIRRHWDWATEDLSLESLEETEAFHKAKLSIDQGKENTWQEDFNQDGSHDWRDLTVQSERVRIVWDGNNDGRADSSNIMAESFNSMVTGVAAGVTYYRDQIFLAVAPDLWRIVDKDGNGLADEIESISHGYGIHIGYAGHDMSGLTVGPDGKVYWSIGDLGVNTVDQTGKRWKYPHHGAVMRANPDGSDFEVFAYGLRNPQELAFDEFGNLISVDNDGDHAGEHERIVHIINGSDTGWRTYWQFGKYNQPGGDYKVWMDEKLHVPYFKGQPAYILPPLALAADGPAGLAYNPGTALGEKWKGYFFASYFTGSSARSKIHAFKLEPVGASFDVVEDKEVLTGLNMTGITFGPDGALYMADWLEGWDKKPQGRIWKLDVEDKSLDKKRKEVQQILAEGMSQRDNKALFDLLAHSDMRVRMEAQFELVARGDIEMLSQAVHNRDVLLRRLHGIWGLGQLAATNNEIRQTIAAFLEDDHAEVRAQAAKVLGDLGYRPAEDQLIGQLDDANPRAVFYAVEALGKIGSMNAFEPIVEVLERTGDSDIHLRYATFIALGRIGNEDALVALKSHPSLDVRLGAVVALRRMRSAQVADFLYDKHPAVATEAARAIHDDESIPEAIPALAEALTKSRIKEEAFVRRAVNANLRLGGEESANRLAAYAASRDALPGYRVVALEALGFWPNPNPLDWVEGRYRGLTPYDPQQAIAAVSQHLESLLTGAPAEVQIAAAQMSGKLDLQMANPILYQLVKAASQPEEVRSAALAAMFELDSDQILEALEWIMEGNNRNLRQEAQFYLVNMDTDEENIAGILASVLQKGTLDEKQNALINIASLSGETAQNILQEWLGQLKSGDIEPELELDVIMAIEKSGFEDLKNELAGYESQLKEESPLALYDPAMYGGDPEKGGIVFYKHQAAQCIKCHQINGQGGQVGPDLTQIGNKLDRKQLLTSLIAPSKRIAPGYGIVTLTLNDGKTIAGTIMGENEKEVALKTATGETQSIAVTDIRERKDAPSSMPRMDLILTKAEIRDLVAYLAVLKDNDGKLTMKNN